MIEVEAFIALGSNLHNPVQQILQGLSELKQLPHTQLAKISRLYQSAPMGPQNQDNFINGVASIITRLSPEELLSRLQQVEQQHDRKKTQIWGPRTLDLDILLYGDKIITTPHLIIPHPGIAKRSFVLYPLQEIAPKLTLPDGRRIQDLIDNLEETYQLQPLDLELNTY